MEKNKEQKIKALKRELVLVSFLGIPGPIMAATGGISLLLGEENLLHPMLANPLLTVPMMMLGVALVIWEGRRVLPLQAKLKALQAMHIVPKETKRSESFTQSNDSDLS